MMQFSQPLPDLTSTLPTWSHALNQQLADRLRLASADVQTAATVGHGAVDVAAQAYALAQKVGASALVNHPGGGYTAHHVRLGTPGTLAQWRPISPMVSRPMSPQAPSTRFAVVQAGAPVMSGGALQGTYI